MSKKRDRTERRERERATRKLVRSREVLAKLELGGSAAQPIEVTSSSVIEVRATSIPCPQCAGKLKVEDHQARMLNERSLRVLNMRCQLCGVARELWFSISSPLAN